MKEALITINGIVLTESQSMTVRVAVVSFVQSLARDGLGDDESGKEIAQAYLDNLWQINELLSRPRMLIKTRL